MRKKCEKYLEILLIMVYNYTIKFVNAASCGGKEKIWIAIKDLILWKGSLPRHLLTRLSTSR